MEFKTGDEVIITEGNPVYIGEGCQVGDVCMIEAHHSPGWVYVRDRHGNVAGFQPGGHGYGEAVINSPRVPLAEVKTKEEAEAWIGEEVGVVRFGRGGEAGGIRPIKYGAIKQHLANRLVFFFDGGGCDRWAFPENLRPLSQEPKAKVPTAGGGLIIDRPITMIPVENSRATCPHCRADSRCEDHAQDCPCKPVAEKVVDPLVTDRLARQSVLDDLAKRWQPHPLVLERIKRIREANRLKGLGR